MISVSKKRCDAYGVNTYVADFESDVSKLPIHCTPGSKAICLETGKRYMLNNGYIWKELPSGGGGGGDEDDVIYDGGIVDTEPNNYSEEVIYDGGNEVGN